MRIELFFTPSEVKEEELQNRTVLVIDVLRASTTIAYALHNGCKGIIPTNSIDGAIELSKKIGRDSALLCGEREGVKIEGFDLGNSPFEYEAEKIKDKTLIFATTNGSKAIVKGSNASSLTVGSFVNFQSTFNYLHSSPSELTIICSGKLDQFAIEDAVCGGLYVSSFLKQGEYQLNDAAFAALKLYEGYSNNILEMLKKSSHGRYLIELGFEKDLHLCSELNSLKVIPLLDQGKLISYDSEFTEKIKSG
jgi:2-phosphosulfolactate phosphatase